MAKNMTELQKIADAVEALAGGGGGGGSTGGVMVVHAIYEPYEDPEREGGDYTLDKTFQEIQDAMESTGAMIVVVKEQNGYKYVYSYSSIETGYNSQDKVYFVYVGDRSIFGVWGNQLTTTSTSGYPTTKFGEIS